MPGSCNATDVQNLSLTAVAPDATPGCPREQYCDERAHGREPCPPGRCRFGGREHDKPPCPDHPTPWGLAPVAATHAPAPELSAEGARRRPETVERLAADLERLVGAMSDAVSFGGLAPSEYAHLHHLQLWLGRLVAERDARKRGNGNGRKKKR